MTADILDLADRLWRGQNSTSDLHPVSHLGGLAEICDGIAFLPAQANMTVIRTEDGLILIDTGSPFAARANHDEVRGWTGERLSTAIYSHGHIDHACGVPVWEAEAAERRWPAPIVLAHEALPRRFDRYKLTNGYNQIINQRRFSASGSCAGLRSTATRTGPTPDEMAVDVGGVQLTLRHEKRETDDHTVTWIPDRHVLCSGDLFIWAVPNAGNPQKVQRYPREWGAGIAPNGRTAAGIPASWPWYAYNRRPPHPARSYRNGGIAWNP